MPVVVILIVILGVAVGVFTVFIVRSVVAPKQVETLASLLKQNRTAPVIKLARRIIGKEPRNSDAHYFLGMAYLAERKPELALMELKTVNQIGMFGGYCKEIPFRRTIAELYAKFNQAEEALKEYLLLMKLDPMNASNYYEVGRLFEERNRTDKAAQFYKKSVSIDDRHAAAHFRLGHILYRAKRPIEARSELEKSIRSQPENPEAHYYLGRLQKDAHEYMAAIASFEKSSREQSLKVKSLIERGGCYISLNNLERAISELERAVQASPDDASQDTLYGRYFLAVCYERSRNIEAAIEQWQLIFQKKQNFRDVSEKLSQYQDVQSDDQVKDFLTANQSEFLSMCTTATMSMGLQVRDSTPSVNGCMIVAVEPQNKWRNTRKIPQLIQFLRATELVDESTVRNFHEEMKKQNITRGIMVSSSGFSRLAMDFAESRPIDLYNKDKLQTLLHQVDA
ncbi:MAG TPA: tetratricopeptide repeat protein [Spirochaetia bacterium]|nr:tetratricopeptide repeat protein [Spirochaetia bacterium]